MRGCVCSGIWVVRLTNLLRAVGSYGRCATGIGPGGRIVGTANRRAPVRSISSGTGAVVAAAPGSISIVGVASVYDRAAVPVAVPVAVAPSATIVIAYGRAHGDANSEREQAGRSNRCSAVPRRDITPCDIRSAVNYRGIVLWNINDLRIRRLDHDHLRRLLHDCNL